MARRIILALALLPLMLAGLAAARAEGPPVVHPAAPLAPDFIRSLAPVPVLPQASPEVNAGDPQQAIPKAASSPEARVAVLIYHDVHPHPDNPYTVTPERLGADLQWFLDHGWRALTLRQFADWMGGDLHLAGDWFLLTFDDGYRGWADHGYPVLQERGVPQRLVGRAVDLVHIHARHSPTGNRARRVSPGRASALEVLPWKRPRRPGMP